MAAHGSQAENSCDLSRAGSQSRMSFSLRADHDCDMFSARPINQLVHVNHFG